MMRGLLAGMALSLMPTLAASEATNQRYTCERGVQVPVVYVNSGDMAIAVLLVEGNQILLYSEPVASGARYGWPSDGSNYVWLTKDTQAMLLWRDGAAKTETTVLAECVRN